MHKPLRVGITGGIGSGKTIICKVFEQLGVPVYYSDETSKELLNTHQPIIKALKTEFGEAIYLSDGKIDRKGLADIVFNNKEKLEKLNSITHPLVRAHFLEWTQAQTTLYILKEAAIMYESNASRDLDLMITVFAPVEIRTQRAMQREGISKDAVEARMSKQMSEEDKMKRADFIIYNDDVQPVLPQVLKLHEHLLGIVQTV